MDDRTPPRLAHSREIEGLRAVAVAIVVLYHAGVPGFAGGYVGVDVFFVVSGFLITSLLIAEKTNSGRIALGSFFARRFRRLLPAAALVLTATVLASRWLWDPLRLDELRSDVWHAVLFAANWGFVQRSTDYLSAELSPSPLQHWWSLAVEEQFYLLWPALIAAATWRAKNTRVRVAGAATVITVASFATCVIVTGSNQPWAFFMLPSRAWEMAAGGLLATLVGALRKLPGALRSTAGWFGIAGLAGIVATFDATLPFPGFWAALPVVATLLILISGDSRHGPTVLLGTKTCGWLGARSYSLYLWHWPALVLATSWAGRALLWWETALLVTGALVAAAATYKLLEQPVRNARALTRSTAASLAAGAASSLLAVAVTALALHGPTTIGPGEAVATPTIASPTTSTTPPSTTGTRPQQSTSTTSVTTVPARLPVPAEAVIAARDTTQLPANIRPALENADGDVPVVYGDGCHADFPVTKLRECSYANTDSSFTVVLLGDSHAAQWFSAVETVAVENSWRLVNLTKKGCPVADVTVFLKALGRTYDECDTWRQNALTWLENEKPQLVLISQHRYRLDGRSGAGDENTVWKTGFETALRRITSAVGRVIVLSDTPTPGIEIPSCLARNTQHLDQCAADPHTTVISDRIALERQVAETAGAAHVDVTGWVCATDTCPAVVGDMIVYRDTNHLTDTYVRWLMPYLREAIDTAS